MSNWRNGSYLQLGKQCERLAQESPQWRSGLTQEFAKTRCASPRFSAPWPQLNSIFYDSWNLTSHNIFERQRVDTGFLSTKRSTSSAWRWAALISCHWRCCFIYSDCIWIKISVSVCLLSLFVWGLLSVIAVNTVVPQDKIYPANSVSVLDSFLSRGCD